MGCWAGLGWSGLVWAGLIWFGLVWAAGLGWFGMVWDGLGWSGLVWAGLGWFAVVWIGMGWFGLVWAGLRWFGLVWAGFGWLGLVFGPAQAPQRRFFRRSASELSAPPPDPLIFGTPTEYWLKKALKKALKKTLVGKRGGPGSVFLLVLFGLSWFRRVWAGLDWLGLAWNGLGWSGLVWDEGGRTGELGQERKGSWNTKGNGKRPGRTGHEQDRTTYRGLGLGERTWTGVGGWGEGQGTSRRMTTGRGQSKRFPPQANTHTTNYIEQQQIYKKIRGGDF